MLNPHPYNYRKLLVKLLEMHLPGKLKIQFNLLFVN